MPMPIFQYIFPANWFFIMRLEQQQKQKIEKKKILIKNHCQLPPSIWHQSELRVLRAGMCRPLGISADASLYKHTYICICIRICTEYWALLIGVLVWWVFFSFDSAIWPLLLTILSSGNDLLYNQYATPEHVMSLAVNYLMMRCAHCHMPDLFRLERTCSHLYTKKKSNKKNKNNFFLANKWIEGFYGVL